MMKLADEEPKLLSKSVRKRKMTKFKSEEQ